MFVNAIAWHQFGKAAAPDAPSVQYVQAILDELNRALLLMALTPELDRTAPVNEFLERHGAAPYE